MTNSVENPDDVLKSLLAKKCRSDKEIKLNKLHQLCRQEYERHGQGTRDLSLANISKLAELAGIFKARAIYNHQSKDYAELINVWAAFDGAQKIQPQIHPHDNGKYFFLEKIEDPAIRSLCHIGLIERDKLKVELNVLKSQSHVVIDMRPLGKQAVSQQGQVTLLDAETNLTDSERSALALSIDPKSLAERKWKIGSAGEILDQRDRFVFFPGFASGISKVIKRR